MSSCVLSNSEGFSNLLSEAGICCYGDVLQMRTLSLERFSDSQESHYQAVAEPPFELRSAGFPSLHCSSHYILMPFSLSHLMSWPEGGCLVQTSHFTLKGVVSEGRTGWPGGAQCPGLSHLRLLSPLLEKTTAHVPWHG